MRVAIIHDWLNGMRGGEIVLESILRLFPEATVYTLFYDRGSVSTEIETHEIITSFVDRIPFRGKYYRYLLPLFPYAVESFALKDYDLVISISHCVAKGVITSPGTMHVSYLLTPMRYAWDMFEEYFGEASKVKKFAISFFIKKLREWDVYSSSRVDNFIAISHCVAERIRKYYRRNSRVIHPPVYTERFEVSRKNEGFYLIVSALVPYKRIDIAVKAFKINRKELIIIGSGQEERKIKKMCAEYHNIKCLGWQPSEVVRKYMERCKAFILPGEEDFGIAPVEAMACGKPVVAFGKGGIRDTAIPLEDTSDKEPTGIFFHSLSPHALNEAIEKLERLYNEFNPYSIRKQAELFSEKKFKEKFMKYIHDIMKEKDNGSKKGIMEKMV